MDDQRRIFLIGGDDDEQAVFTLREAEEEDCRIECVYRDKSVEGRAADYFEALCAVRQQLAKDGLIPFCYGASLNVYPSGMARDMGQGLKAYRLTTGQPAKTADLVEIFAEGPDIIPASVEAQEQFFDDWIISLRS